MYTGGCAEGDIQRGMYREGYTEGCYRGGYTGWGYAGEEEEETDRGISHTTSHNVVVFYTLQHNVSAKTILCEGQVPAITP